MKRILLSFALLASAGISSAGDYFLDGAQKRELLMDGRITGHEGAQYDVWIVPGYRYSSREVHDGWHAAGQDLEEYGKPGYRRQIVDLTQKVMRYGRKDVLHEFALVGTADTWRDAAATANRRVERRVFGWWLAWPWAVVSAGVESAVRVGVGVPGGVAIWGGGAVVTPAAMLAWPATMSAVHSLGEGTTLPVVSAGWNTVIGPPLALLGQQPAPERADGWWMKRLQDPAEADIRARVAAWEHGWQAEPDVAASREAYERREADHVARSKALNEQLERENSAWQADSSALGRDYQQRALQRAMATLPALRAEMAAQGYTGPRLEAQHDVLVQELMAQGLDSAGAEQVFARLVAPAGN